MAALGVPLALIIVFVTAIAAAVSTTGPTLLRKEVIKKPCRYDFGCARNAYCKLQKECACKEGFFVYRETLRTSEVCLKRVMGEGDDCVESVQCQLVMGPSAECRPSWDTSICRCVEWAHLVDNYCYNTSRVGQHCVSKNNCLIEGGPALTCAGGECVCPRLQHGSSDGLRCLDDRHLSDECRESEECITTNSHCMGICECRVHYVADEQNRRCLRVADNVGDMCEEDLQCNRFLRDSECSRHGECECVDGYHPSPQGTRCWRSSLLGESCAEDLECLGQLLPLTVPYNQTRTECHNNICRCASGFHADLSGRICLGGSVARPELTAWLIFLMAALAVGSKRV